MAVECFTYNSQLLQLKVLFIVNIITAECIIYKQ